jgi:hypothetical protein
MTVPKINTYLVIAEQKRKRWDYELPIELMINDQNQKQDGCYQWR